MELGGSLGVDFLQPAVEFGRQSLLWRVVVIFGVVGSTTFDRCLAVGVAVVVVFVDEDFPEQALDVVVGATADDRNGFPLQEIVDDWNRLKSLKEVI